LLDDYLHLTLACIFLVTLQLRARMFSGYPSSPATKRVISPRLLGFTKILAQHVDTPYITQVFYPLVYCEGFQGNSSQTSSELCADVLDVWLSGNKATGRIFFHLFQEPKRMNPNYTWSRPSSTDFWNSRPSSFINCHSS